ncbi:TPA: hypothetical protein HA344_06690 [Candidatus Bathyarchaeota archaeon]|nr:hypothetical protein [Candidatus Bathyarchaeota archaeon]
MNLEIVFPKNGTKITSLTAIGLLVLSALLPAMMVSTVTPPTLGGNYGSIDGVLGTDTYTLYP